MSTTRDDLAALDRKVGQIFSHYDTTYGELIETIEKQAPCYCPSFPSGRTNHAAGCPTSVIREKLRAYDKAHEAWTRLNEREKIARKLAARATQEPPGWSNRPGLISAVRIIRRMWWPR